ncbi:excalibur calcium-binding domain-containing protein [Domibacillus sp. A3M-37]|nr:excalibur calcium-binding domain-containing protein [Domibacillus sp. A3M-37]MCP3763937.1 excalibur calcium-binding domain-containing protein [Domibacillus sp. A3M-37]
MPLSSYSKKQKAKYLDGVKKGHPAYDEKHDCDKDGYACEKS